MIDDINGFVSQSIYEMMRTLLLTLIFLVIFSSCEKQYTILTDRYYSGSLIYCEQPLFTAISFHGNSYVEVQSGGAFNQKFPCFAKGTCNTKHNKISFLPTEILVVPDCQCRMLTGVKFECLLSGDYTPIQSGNSLIFQRGREMTCKFII